MPVRYKGYVSRQDSAWTLRCRTAFLDSPDQMGSRAMEAMDLTVWLPSLFFLGLIGMGLMFAFVAGCDRV
jgi:hypothetical protein